MIGLTMDRKRHVHHFGTRMSIVLNGGSLRERVVLPQSASYSGSELRSDDRFAVILEE